MRRSVTGQAVDGRADRLPRHVRVLLRLSRRELPEPVCSFTVERGIEVPASDGVALLTDHYHPAADGRYPTVLVRTPYGRGFPWDYIYGALFARQGFHVVIQSCRGTGGSGGTFEPFVAEVADAKAAVSWLREQDWFTGALGTVGASYLAYVQWALATDPPPELRAMVVQVGSDDFHGFLYPGGAFALESTLVGIAAMLSMERGFARFGLAIARLLRHNRRVQRTLPLIDGYPAAFGRRVDFLEQWLAHPRPDDPYWATRRAVPDASQVPPASLLTGWTDVCLDPTLAMYRRLRDAGRDVRLIVGPWNHASGFSDDMPVIFAEALEWLRTRLADDAPDSGRAPGLPVRVHIGQIGTKGEWRDLPGWPPPRSKEQPWYLGGDGTLRADPAPAAQVSSLRYDPAKPTPSLGGPSMDSRHPGPRRNNRLEARADVLTFTSPPFTEPVEVAGPVSIKLRVRGSSPHFDVFARLCDVDARGRSWNICDGLIRLGGTAAGVIEDPSPAGGGRPWSDITVPMSATAHRFGAGHRLRVQISGGAHPRYARNTGTGDPIATATALVPVDIEISHDPNAPCLLSLPVFPGSNAT